MVAENVNGGDGPKEPIVLPGTDAPPPNSLKASITPPNPDETAAVTNAAIASMPQVVTAEEVAAERLRGAKREAGTISIQNYETMFDKIANDPRLSSQQKREQLRDLKNQASLKFQNYNDQPTKPSSTMQKIVHFFLPKSAVKNKQARLTKLMEKISLIIAQLPRDEEAPAAAATPAISAGAEKSAGALSKIEEVIHQLVKDNKIDPKIETNITKKAKEIFSNPTFTIDQKFEKLNNAIIYLRVSVSSQHVLSTNSSEQTALAKTIEDYNSILTKLDGFHGPEFSIYQP